MKETQPTAQSTPAVDIADEELLQRFRQRGDLEAFDQLVHRYEGELYRYLRRYVGDSQLAEDLFQATFLKVYQQSHQFHAGRRVRPWLYSIATHQAIDWLRKMGRRPAVSLDQPGDAGEQSDDGTLLDLLEAETPTPEIQAETKERAERVRRTVNELPENLRIVAVLVFFQGLKYSEVAEVLGIPTGTVKSRVHSALVKLNTAWRHQQPA
jgi:RNA polymerase sigma-70 factor (ECF subfamily)